MSFHLHIGRPKRPSRVDGIFRNFKYDVILKSGRVMPLKAFCEHIKLNYPAVRSQIKAHSHWDGQVGEPFQKVIAEMIQRRAKNAALSPPCPHCNGTGRAARVATPPTV